MIVGADHTTSVCSPLPLSTEARAHDLSGLGGGWGGSQPLDKSLPLPQPFLLVSEIKQTFPSINLVFLLSFAMGPRGAGAAGPAFS